MWSESWNGEGGIRAIGTKRVLHGRRLVRYKISPRVKWLGQSQLQFNNRLCQEVLI